MSQSRAVVYHGHLDGDKIVSTTPVHLGPARASEAAAAWDIPGALLKAPAAGDGIVVFCRVESN